VQFWILREDIKEMALKIVQLIKDEPLRMKMGESAYRDSIKYSEERIMKQWTDLFDEVTCEK
jgi:glycosyltransferase involved in cell wall biosynthesis